MKKIAIIATISVLAAGLAACQSREDRAVGGALLGGTAGAVIGGIAGDGRGALIGGTAGAVAGGVIGYNTAPKRKCWRNSYGQRVCRR